METEEEKEPQLSHKIGLQVRVVHPSGFEEHHLVVLCGQHRNLIFLQLKKDSTNAFIIFYGATYTCYHTGG
jgi:hypothetical protein